MAPGKPLADAETIFEGAGTDVRVNASADRTPGFERTGWSPGRCG